MNLNIGKFTGITPNGSKIYQSIENGAKIITSVKDGKIAQQIQLRKFNGNLNGYSVRVDDAQKGVTHIASNITDYGFDEQYNTITKSIIDNDGTLKKVAITKSKNGDSVEIEKAQIRKNGEEFYLSENVQKEANGTTTVEKTFETSKQGWTKPDGSYINGFHQDVEIHQDGRVLHSQEFGDIDTLPQLNELV